MTNEIGLREARKEIGPIADRAHLAGEITYLTRHGKPIAAVVPLDRIKETAVPVLQYALCWEDPAGDEAWVIRCRPFSDKSDEAWDSWLFHSDLGEADEAVAKAWAAERFAENDLTVDDWHRDQHGDLIPEFT